MEKEIKKAIDEIEVPMEKLDDAIAKGIKQGKPKTKRYAIPLFASVAMIGIILCSGFVSPKMGNVLANMPFIGFMYKIEEHDVGLHVAMMDENKVTLNEVIESNGVTITVEDVVYDGTRIAFTYTQEKYDEIYPLTIKVNGEEINFSESLRGKLEAESGFRGLIEFIPTEPLPDSFHLEVSIYRIGDVEGRWVFSTDITKVNNHSRALIAGQEGMVNGVHYTIQKAERSSTGTTIEIVFDPSNLFKLYTAERFIQFNFTDQNGMPIQTLYSSGVDNVFQFMLAPLSDEVTEIHVLPFQFSPTIEEPVEIIEELKGQFPQRISQGEMGDIVITNVEKVGNEYKMTFYSTSDFPFDARFTPNFLDVVDEDGNILITDYPKAIGPNEYELKYQGMSGTLFVKTIKLPNMEIEESAKTVIAVK